MATNADRSKDVITWRPGLWSFREVACPFLYEDIARALNRIEPGDLAYGGRCDDATLAFASVVTGAYAYAGVCHDCEPGERSALLLDIVQGLVSLNGTWTAPAMRWDAYVRRLWTQLRRDWFGELCASCWGTRTQVVIYKGRSVGSTEAMTFNPPPRDRVTCFDCEGTGRRSSAPLVMTIRHDRSGLRQFSGRAACGCVYTAEDGDACQHDISHVLEHGTDQEIHALADALMSADDPRALRGVQMTMCPKDGEA